VDTTRSVIAPAVRTGTTRSAGPSTCFAGVPGDRLSAVQTTADTPPHDERDLLVQRVGASLPNNTDIAPIIFLVLMTRSAELAASPPR